MIDNNGVTFVQGVFNHDFYSYVHQFCFQLKVENEEEKRALSELKNQLKTLLQLDPQKEVLCLHFISFFIILYLFRSV